MSLKHFCDLLLAVTAAVLCLAPGQARAAWPNGPFTSSGRWIADASGTIVTYAGVNWPGHVETMIPEGLQHQSIQDIVSKIKGIGINSIRLTYAIEMVDQIESSGGNDVSIKTAFTSALGQQNGTTVYEKVIAKNPSFGDSTTRLQVFDAIAAECAKQQIYVHLDNHVSKAGWCCSPLDGNTWWGDTHFSISNWTRGLSYMANHGKQWTNLMSMSLRNELRQPFLNQSLYTNSYNWQDWYKYTKQGADAIHASNSDVLIFLSGLNSDTTLQPIVQKTPLTPGSSLFNLEDFQGYSNKIVLELHNYANILGGAGLNNCTALTQGLSQDGFQALGDAPTKLPVVMTEFGFQQDATTWKDTFASCLEKYLADQQAGWMLWALSGSYYIREGTQDADESWGLLTHDWSTWRSPEHVNGGLASLIKSTLAVNGTVSNGGGTQNGGSSGNNTGKSEASNRYGSATSGRWQVMTILLISFAAVYIF